MSSRERKREEGMVPKAGLYQNGLLKSLKTWAIPFSFRARNLVGESVLFIAGQSVSARLVALLNTGITPAPHLAHTGVPFGMGPIRASRPASKRGIGWTVEIIDLPA